MSDTGPPRLPSAPVQPAFSPPQPNRPPWPAPIASDFRRPTRWPMFAVLVIALVAVGLSTAALFSTRQSAHMPTPPTAPNFTEQQAADTKNDVCTAFRTVRQAIFLNSNRTSPVEGDFGATWAIAANSRLALEAGAAYLLDRLAFAPATPSDLADAVKSLALKLRQAAVIFLAEEPDAIEETVKRDVEQDIAVVNNLCK